MEGSQDRPNVNFAIDFLKDRAWNYYVEKACGKVQLINDTGLPSIYGELVNCSQAVDMAFDQTLANDNHCIGVVAQPDIADGELCWIIYEGIAQVLLEDASASTHGYWGRTSITQAGRADFTNPLPPGNGILEADRHFYEIGHILESVTAGTDKLAKAILHFN